MPYTSRLSPPPVTSHRALVPALLCSLAVAGACSDAMGPDEEHSSQERVLFTSSRAGNLSEAGEPLFDLYAVNADGTEPVRLTQESSRYRHLRLSPDGSTVAFYSELSGCYDVWTMSVDGTALTQLTGVAENQRCNAHPEWSPDGTKIAFLTSRNVREGRGWDVYVMDADGANPVDVTANPSTDPETAEDYVHGWSPDGRVVLTSTRDGELRTYLAAADGSGVEPLFGDNLYLYPYWSPDGSRVVAYRNQGAFGELYVMGADGRSALRLGDGGDAAISMRTEDPWSPDGNWVAVASNRTGNPEIFVADVDGGSLENVSNHPGHDDFLNWTSDGRILFQSDRSGDLELYVMDADGSHLVNLSNAPESEDGSQALWVPPG